MNGGCCFDWVLGGELNSGAAGDIPVSIMAVGRVGAGGLRDSIGGDCESDW